MPRPRRKAPALAPPSAAISNVAPSAPLSPTSNGNGAGSIVAIEAAADPEPEPMAAADDVAPAEQADIESNGAAEDLWVGHRPLIRATLPRTEGDPPPTPRPIPEFTMHQRQGRGGHGFRHGQWQDRNGNGPGGFRHGNQGNGQGRGPQQAGQGGRRHRHRNKSRRSR